jgi:hypothetical protein
MPPDRWRKCTCEPGIARVAPGLNELVLDATIERVVAFDAGIFTRAADPLHRPGTALSEL